MPEPNVTISVANPNLMYDGLSPYAPFAVRYIQLYRYGSEAAARAATTLAPGTLVNTFTLATINSVVTDDAGPWRYGFYDAVQGPATWYRYRLADLGQATVSELSLPWQADNRDSWTLKDILLEVGSTMGGEGFRATASAGSASSITAPSFLSSLYDAYSFKGQWVWNEATGAEARVALIAPATGVATLDAPISGAPFTAGSLFQLHALLQPSELVKLINRVRDQMRVLTWQDIALNVKRDVYPAPEGVYSEADVVDAEVGHGYANSPQISYVKVACEVDFDGFRAWLRPRVSTSYSTLRVRVSRTIRDMEGDLLLPGDTTQALMKFLRPAVAWEAYRWLSEADPDDSGFFQLTGIKRLDVEAAAQKYQPRVNRVAAPRQLFGPGMR